jgi:4'-phosphopantetheinyl transferase
VAPTAATSAHRHPRTPVPVPEPEPVPIAWIWRIDLADDRRQESVAATHLHDSERERAARGTGAVRRRRILLRAGLRQALGELLVLPPADVPLVEDDGRPLVGGDRQLHVSCSASGRVGLVAIVAGSEVGVDVQEHHEQDALAASVEGWLAPAEEIALGRLPAARRPLAVTRAWTQKEAVLKGLGRGCASTRTRSSHRWPRPDASGTGFSVRCESCPATWRPSPSAQRWTRSASSSVT